MPDWLLNWICLSHSLEGIMYYFANLLFWTSPCPLSFLFLCFPPCSKKFILEYFLRVCLKLLTVDSLCRWKAQALAHVLESSFMPAQVVWHSKSNSIRGLAQCNGWVEAGMPEILQRERWYSTHKVLQSETTDQEHLLEVVNFVWLCNEEFSKLCLFSGGSCVGICCWVDNRIVRGEVVPGCCLLIVLYSLSHNIERLKFFKSVDKWWIYYKC